MTETLLSSANREVCIGFDRPFVIIGERINPTGRKILAEEMKNGAAVVAISNDETGISEDPDVRFGVAKKIVECRWWGARSRWSRAPSPNDE